MGNRELRRMILPRTPVNKGNVRRAEAPLRAPTLPRKTDADALLTTALASVPLLLPCGASCPRRAVRHRSGERGLVAAPSQPRWAALRGRGQGALLGRHARRV